MSKIHFILNWILFRIGLSSFVSDVTPCYQETHSPVNMFSTNLFVKLSIRVLSLSNACNKSFKFFFQRQTTISFAVQQSESLDTFSNFCIHIEGKTRGEELSLNVC